MQGTSFHNVNSQHHFCFPRTRLALIKAAPAHLAHKHRTTAPGLVPACAACGAHGRRRAFKAGMNKLGVGTVASQRGAWARGPMGKSLLARHRAAAVGRRRRNRCGLVAVAHVDIRSMFSDPPTHTHTLRCVRHVSPNNRRCGCWRLQTPTCCERAMLCDAMDDLHHGHVHGCPHTHGPRPLGVRAQLNNQASEHIQMSHVSASCDTGLVSRS